MVMKETLQDKLARALIGRGEREVKGRTRKYRTFTFTKGGAPPGLFYFLGRGGALRTGMNIAQSLAMLPSARTRLLAEAQAMDEAVMVAVRIVGFEEDEE